MLANPTCCRASSRSPRRAPSSNTPRRSTSASCCPSSPRLCPPTASRQPRRGGDVAGREGPSGEEPETDPGAGTMLRPEARVLADETLVPEANLVRPPPNRFTHQLALDEPYRLDRPDHAGEPDGVLPAGTPVAVLVEGSERYRVVDGNGLYVEVRRASVRRLPD